jgi:hypothetical protein
MSLHKIVTGVALGAAILALFLSAYAFKLSGKESNTTVVTIPASTTVAPSAVVTASPSAEVLPTKKVFVPVKTVVPSVEVSK